MIRKQDRTMIQVSKQTREKLAELGKKRETYEKIINDLLDFYSERQCEP